MSRPPIAGVSQKPSGIQESVTGERLVAASRRPDGTLRKELKIRPGYTPEEDVTRYRSTRMAESEARAAVKGRIPGLAPSAVQAAVSGMSKSAKKNAKRKEKRAEDDAEEDVPDSWDADDSVSSCPSTATPQPSSTAASKPSPTPAKAEPTPPPPAPEPPAPVVEDSKRVKALRKKLRQAESLKERDGLGLYLPPAERVKISGIPDLEAELAKLLLSEDGPEEGAGAA